MNQKRNWAIEKDFMHKGLRCVVVMQSAGHRCGYVGITKQYPLYKKDYDDYLPINKSELPNDKEISGVFQAFISTLDKNDRIRIAAFFEVHGGITYAGGGKKSEYPVESDLWWFGFDCAHCWDANDYETAVWIFKDDPEILDMLKRNRYSRWQTHGTIRTLEYVENECKKLADQLIDYRCIFGEKV